jgi:hypothetical protein
MQDLSSSSSVSSLHVRTYREYRKILTTSDMHIHNIILYVRIMPSYVTYIMLLNIEAYVSTLMLDSYARNYDKLRLQICFE